MSAKCERHCKPINLADATIQESNQGGKYYINRPHAIAHQRRGRKTNHDRDAGGPIQKSKARNESAHSSVASWRAAPSLRSGLGILGILIFCDPSLRTFLRGGPRLSRCLHDVLITVGVFSLLHRELDAHHGWRRAYHRRLFNYDTIVVYDRIREGLASGRKGSIEQIMNESINQTAQPDYPYQHRHFDPDSVSLPFSAVRFLRDFSLAIIIGVAGRDLLLPSSLPHRLCCGGPVPAGGGKTSLPTRNPLSKQTKPSQPRAS